MLRGGVVVFAWCGEAGGVLGIYLDPETGSLMQTGTGGKGKGSRPNAEAQGKVRWVLNEGAGKKGSDDRIWSGQVRCSAVPVPVASV
jgi:hypothetical protein